MHGMGIVTAAIGSMVVLVCVETGSGQDGPNSVPAGESKPATAPEFCLLLANHWSYTGVGWSKGLKSVEQSIADSLAMADYDPGVKTGINLDAPAYALIAESNPDLIARLRRYLAEGKVEIIGGSYGQPMASMVSGESNIRQLVVGQQTIRKTLGVTVTAFLEEEEFTHPQMPQLLKGAGFRFASTAQCNTCGKHGSPPLDLNVFLWQGLDGTRILTTPINGLVFHPPMVTHDIDWLWSPAGRKRLEELRRLGMPLAIKWVEFGWGPNELEGKTANKFFASRHRQLAEKYRVRHTTLTEYLDRHGAQAKERIQWKMDDFRKLEPWGSGGDRLRREGRQVEAALLAAERFDAAAALLGLAHGREADLGAAWKHLLAAQSHDVSLCEYESMGGISDGIARQFIAATGTAEDNRHVNTWGTMGLRQMAVAGQMARNTLDAALRGISGAVDTATENRGETAAVVFNPCGFQRDAVVTVRGAALKAGDGARLVVRDEQGHAVPSRVLQSERPGDPAKADVVFLARRLPPFGYATYYLAAAGGDAPPPDGDLRTSDTEWRLENAAVSVQLDPSSGAIARLVDRRSGADLIDGKRRAFPVFRGRPNRKLAGGKDVPEEYDSAKSKADIRWVERGPLRAAVKVAHAWPLLRLEHWITLHAGLPQVEVAVRLSADVPPAPTAERVNAWQPPLHVNDGYWLSFASAFKPTAVIRDFPFGVEPCGKDAIDALNFLDVTGPRGGLLVVHGGTQYFKRSEDVVLSNLVMRDWYGIFSRPGWPRTADYRFALIPHGADFTNADRLRCVEQFDQQPVCVLEGLHAGRLARRRSFASVDAGGVVLSAFRGAGGGAYEVRLVEQDGVPANARLRVDLPVKRFTPCDSLGKAADEYRPLDGGQIDVPLGGWQIRTLRVE